MSRAFAFINSLAIALIVAETARAFPDLIRHNYVNCTACHVSPTGGGVLNAYGRAMSREVLSAWGTEREGEFLHGALPEGTQPEWLQIGGDLRTINIHKESPSKISERWFVMQATPEVAVTAGGFSGAIALGQADPATRSVRWVSPRYYLQWNPLDELAARAGRFVPVFGIYVPYHTLPTRQGLGLAPGDEKDALETVWSGESWNFALSVGRTPEGPVPAANRESLFTAQVNRNFGGSYRVGFSLLRGTSEAQSREAIGAHALLGLSERWAYLSEFTLQTTMPSGGRRASGLYHFSQLLFEVSRGWNLYLLEDYLKSDLDDSLTLTNSIGPGVRFFPRPHFEIDGVFLKKRIASVADRYDDFAWLMLHYYF